MYYYTEETQRLEEEWIRSRWKGNEDKFNALVPIIKTNKIWEGSKEYLILIDAFGSSPTGIRPYRDLRGAPLKGTDLSHADLEGTHLSFAHLEGADLSSADLKGAHLSFAHLEGATLNLAHLEGATVDRAHLEEAYLVGTHLEVADLSEAHLEQAILIGCNLQGANLDRAYLEGADLASVIYIADKISDWWKRRHIRKNFRFLAPRRLKRIKGTTHFGGIDTSKIHGGTNPLLKRHMEDFQFIQAIKEKHRCIYCLWKWSCDCGRSLLIWIFWCFVIALGFGLAYAPITSPSWFPRPVLGFLHWVDPRIYIDPHTYYHHLWTPIYFSIVTFTTLGFGDVQPQNLAGLIWVSVEVILGYVMLGGLISIFANKLARRA